MIIYVEGPFNLIYFYRLQRTYNKKSGRWTVYPVRRKRAMTMLVPFSGKYCFHGRMEMEAGDPRRLSRTVALKLPPPTAELAEERKSQFATQDNE